MPLPSPLAQFFQHPEMYIQSITFDAASAFLQGYDAAYDGRMLYGFREWLVLKLGFGNNLVWTELFLRFAFPESAGPRTSELLNADQKQLVNLLGEAFSNYWVERERLDGLQNLIERHTKWIKEQDWYQEKLESPLEN